MIRNTTNPWGIGAAATKEYYITPSPVGVPFTPEGDTRERVAIYAPIFENTKLLDADPHYISTLKSIKDPGKRRAWLVGDTWESVDTALGPYWESAYHVIPPFRIPRGWLITRSFDWGYTSPFAVLWWAQSNGDPVILDNGDKIHFPIGHWIMIHEWYGHSAANKKHGPKMSAPQIALGIKERELSIGIAGRVVPGNADSSIFDPGVSIAKEMADRGVHWIKSDKSRGSRVNGLQLLITLLMNSRQSPIEKAGIQFFNTCKHTIEQIPSVQRSDKNPDDVDENSDHIIDAIRYVIYSPSRRLEIKRLGGL
jgi:hypothetical protein